MYKFETDQFGLSDTAIHLLRSRFNYHTIELSSVDSIAISRGRQVNNWLLLLLFGLALLAFGLFTAGKVVYEYFFANNYNRFYVEQFVVPILPLFAGVFSIYYALKIGPVLIVSVNNKIKRLPIGQLTDKARVKDVITFLRENKYTSNKFELISKELDS